MKSLRDERAQPDGTVICEHCGKPIVKAYDCIGHHMQELTDDNVDDVTISLNPDNVMLIHFRCHNEIHRRFGYNVRRQKKVFIVWGSPCSGKSTWVRENSDTCDIILDIDRLWAAIRSEKCGEYEKPSELKPNIFDLRDFLLEQIRVRRGRWQNAFIIGGYPMQGERERLADLLGAELIHIDTPKETCMLRACEKGKDWTRFVQNWWERYTPPSNFLS